MSPPKHGVNPESVLDAAAWSLVGPGKDTLRESLESLYWKGVENELENIIHTLKIWKQPQFAGVTVPDEDDGFIHGFDTFVDQVSEEAREFAIRYGKYRTFFGGDLKIINQSLQIRNKITRILTRLLLVIIPNTHILYKRLRSTVGRNT